LPRRISGVKIGWTTVIEAEMRRFQLVNTLVVEELVHVDFSLVYRGFQSNENLW
jgi:hypothetical protein